MARTRHREPPLPEPPDQDRRPRTIELHLIRSAHAGDSRMWNGPDEERPLSRSGRKQVDRLARHLEQLHLRPDVIVCSPRVRAMQTAEPLVARLKLHALEDYRLAEELDLGHLEAILDMSGDPRRAILVGHDPAFSRLTALLVGSPWFHLPNGALVRIDISRPLTPGGGTLRWLLPPDLLKADR